MKMPGCLVCEEPYRDKRLTPFCSIVCRTLARAAFGWRLQHYRIIDPVSNAVLDAGPRFDLTSHALTLLQRKTERARQALLDAPLQTLAPVPEPHHRTDPHTGHLVVGETSNIFAAKASNL